MQKYLPPNDSTLRLLSIFAKLLNSFNGHLKKINPKDEFINIGLEVLRRMIFRREKKGRVGKRAALEIMYKIKLDDIIYTSSKNVVSGRMINTNWG